MSETKEPKIKLFGKTIQLPDNQILQQPAVVVAAGGSEFGGACPAQSYSDAHGDDSSAQYRSCSTNSLREESNLSKGGEEHESEKKELSDSNAVLLKNENLSAQSGDNDNDTAPAKTSKSEEEQSETGNSDEKTLKKPDKIVPCPRCSSMDTKFCYFNNYNVNQPRHFCKNCQRYWTAGGTMRNVPVGAGRRKNKNSTTHYRHITVPEALLPVGADLPNGMNHPTLNQNGTILNFGSDAPLCESMASVLNIAEKSMQSCSRNGFHQLEDQRRNDQPIGTSLTAGIAKDEVRGPGLPEIVVPNGPNFPPVPYFPTGPWPYPWNSVPWSPPVPPPPPGFCPPGYPMPYYPAVPYWGCSVPGPWNVPWITPPTPSPTPGPISPTLGKHSRDDNDNKSAGNEEEGPEKETNPERCLWVPKTLRIDDPGEAAKSSIWATLGIKNEKADRVGGGGLFKTFESKAEEMVRAAESSTVLEANPAALSRSLNFRESS